MAPLPPSLPPPVSLLPPLRVPLLRVPLLLLVRVPLLRVPLLRVPLLLAPLSATTRTATTRRSTSGAEPPPRGRGTSRLAPRPPPPPPHSGRGGRGGGAAGSGREGPLPPLLGLGDAGVYRSRDPGRDGRGVVCLLLLFFWEGEEKNLRGERKRMNKENKRARREALCGASGEENVRKRKNETASFCSSLSPFSLPNCDLTSSGISSAAATLSMSSLEAAGRDPPGRIVPSKDAGKGRRSS